MDLTYLQKISGTVLPLLNVTLIYNIAIQFLSFGITLASIWNKKAALAKKGRRDIYTQHQLSNPVWFHCASLGEFEQARPVIEKLKSEHPDIPVLLTFFSPSGYESKKNYDLADHVMYLPYDTPGKAKKFISHFKPRMAVFVKYELWYHFIKQMTLTKKPVYLLSATFRPKHRYFKWYGGFFRKMLQMLEYIFVQDERSLALLNSINIEHTQLIGDTRYDRVHKLSKDHFEDELIGKFCEGDKPVLIAGSSWAHEELLLQSIWIHQNELKLIVAPHDISKSRINSIQERFDKHICYSEGIEKYSGQEVLIIDNIGLLSKIYRYGNLAFIGGGFSGALHNILEPATYGLPVCFGPKTDRFHEAQDLIDNGEAEAVTDSMELAGFINTFKLSNGDKNKRFVLDRTGATERFYDHISSDL